MRRETKGGEEIKITEWDEGETEKRNEKWIMGKERGGKGRIGNRECEK